MRVSDEDGVRTITFDRPESKNAMALELATDLADELAALDPEPLDACVLTGDAFSA
ncbi:enoyl-CoA hydratase-related protein, partial [Halobium palmae]